MACHWTYEPGPFDGDLLQGDIIEPTDRVRAVVDHLRDWPPPVAYLVLTQSCDMVRRSRRCRASHLSLAPVQAFFAARCELLDAVCDQVAPAVYTQESKVRARQLLERLLNQNEQALGVFYLHAEEQAGLAESSVAWLRMQSAVGDEHYEVLLAARCGRLNSEFRGKLGWLVGNLYSRIGTQDWDSKELEGQVRQLLGQDLAWVPKASVGSAKAQGVAVECLSYDDAVSKLEPYAPPSATERAADAAVEVVLRVLQIPADDRAKLRNQMINDQSFAAATRR